MRKFQSKNEDKITGKERKAESKKKEINMKTKRSKNEK